MKMFFKLVFYFFTKKKRKKLNREEFTQEFPKLFVSWLKYDKSYRFFIMLYKKYGVQWGGALHNPIPFEEQVKRMHKVLDCYITDHCATFPRDIIDIWSLNDCEFARLQTIRRRWEHFITRFMFFYCKFD